MMKPDFDDLLDWWWLAAWFIVTIIIVIKMLAEVI